MKRSFKNLKNLLTMLCWVVVTMVVIAGCKKQQANDTQFSMTEDSDKEADKKDPNRKLVVATVGDTKITVGMISDEINHQNPYLRARFSSPERKKDFVKNLVRFEVLAQEARRRGFQRDPEVIKRVKRAMIDRLMEDLHGSLVKMEDITDKDIEAYYKANITQYQVPPKVRATQVVTKTEAEAKQVLALAQKKPTDIKNFTELVNKYSIDEQSKNRQGDLDFFSQNSENIPKPVRDAIFAIKGLWQLAGPLKIPQGFVVLMKTGELDAINNSLATEKDRIKNRLFNERRLKAMEKYMDDLQAKASLEINEANLAKIGGDAPSAIPQPSQMPPHPGKMPLPPGKMPPPKPVK